MTPSLPNQYGVGGWDLKSYVGYSWFSSKRQRLRVETTMLCLPLRPPVFLHLACSPVEWSDLFGSNRSSVNLSTSQPRRRMGSLSVTSRNFHSGRHGQRNIPHGIIPWKFHAFRRGIDAYFFRMRWVSDVTIPHLSAALIRLFATMSSPGKRNNEN